MKLGRPTGFRTLREVDLFVKQFDEGDLVVQPNLSSRHHRKRATRLSTAISSYKVAREYYLTKMDEARAGAKEDEEDIEESKTMVGRPEDFAADYDAVPEELDGFKPILWMFRLIAPANAWKKRLDSACELQAQIVDVRAYGMVQDGPGLKTKLKQCQDDNAKLSAQILDYKKQRLPLTK